MKTIISLALTVAFGSMFSPIHAQSLGVVEPYTLPPHWIESFTHEDSSVSKVLVFRSTAGVSYRVQSSHDLQQWNNEQTYYGFGQEIAIPMIQIIAPPSPPPSQPTPPAVTPPQFVTMMVRAATTSGIVLSWKSLDHNQPVEHHLNELALSHFWLHYPFYMRRFDTYYFSLGHPSTPAIPKANQPLGTLDAAMIAAFTTHFAEINQEIAASIERARLNPVLPAPPDPNSRKFFRLVADWTLDSDSDLRPDWLEFMAMQGQNGMLPVTSALDENGQSIFITANPFGDATTPSGKPVGLVADSDQDILSDALDVHPAEPLLNWERASFRYAMFPVSIPDEEEAHDRRALQTNALGQVLFRNTVWRNGAHTVINTEGLSWRHSLAMNDHGHILGNSMFPDAENVTGNMAVNSIVALSWWTEAAAVPIKIKVVTPQGNAYAEMTEAHYMAGIKGEDIYEDSGRFCAPVIHPSNVLQPNQPPNEQITGLWSRNEAGQYGYTQIEEGHHFVKDGTHPWKFPDESSSTIVDNQAVTSLVNKFLRMPTGPQIACTHSYPGSKSHFKKGIGGWKTLRDLESLKDFSPTGIGITEENLLWINRALLPLERMAVSSGTVSAWKDYKLLDLSSEGHLLIAKEGASGGSSIAPAHSAAALGYPFSLIDNEPATGVDNVSQTTVPSDAENNGFQEKLWVMAPQGTWTDPVHGVQPNSNEFTIEVPLGDLTATFTLDNATTNINVLEGGGTVVEFSGAGTSTTDGNMTITMGTNTSMSYPIGVKSMKRRTINLHIYQCQQSSTLIAGVNDSYDFDIAATTEFLNRIYGAQINAYFSITKSTLIAGQNSAPSPLYPLLRSQNTDFITIEAADQMMTSHPFPEDVDIRVFAVAHYIDSRGVTADGYAPRDTNTLFITPFRHYAHHPVNQAGIALRTLAHEIGHILIGEGHPDGGSGAAVLPGTDHSKRLMCSGEISNPHSCLLVKREWDKAEEWLKRRPNGDN